MPYYSAGDYYRGDYYRGGDNYAAGGLFGSLGKVLGKVAGTALSLVPGGGIAKSLVSAAVPFISGKPRKISGPNGGPLVVPVPGVRGLAQRIVPGGATGLMVAGGGFGRRRMNVTNVKALRRAGRRVKGFLKLARRLGALPVGSGKKLFKPKRKKCA